MLAFAQGNAPEVGIARKSGAGGSEQAAIGTPLDAIAKASIGRGWKAIEQCIACCIPDVDGITGIVGGGRAPDTQRNGRIRRDRGGASAPGLALHRSRASLCLHRLRHVAAVASCGGRQAARIVGRCGIGERDVVMHGAAATRLKESREIELAALVSPEVRGVIARRGIELVNYRI